MWIDRVVDRVVDRVLGVAADGDDSMLDAKLHAFRLFLLMHVATEAWVWALDSSPDHSSPLAILAGALRPAHAALPLTLTASFALALLGRGLVLATALAALARFGFLVQTFPNTANHVFLEILCLVLLSVFDPRVRAERQLWLQSCCWVTAILFFYAGLQKMLYGYYFHGDYLAVAVSFDWRYAAVLRPLIPEPDFLRLRSFGEPYAGAGPYRVDSLPFLLVSNASYIAEMLLAALLLIRRTRAFAMAAAVAFMIVTQLIAREVFFGALFVNLLLLFARRDWGRRFLPGFAVFYLYVLATQLQLVRDWFFN